MEWMPITLTWEILGYQDILPRQVIVSMQLWHYLVTTMWPVVVLEASQSWCIRVDLAQKTFSRHALQVTSYFLMKWMMDNTYMDLKNSPPLVYLSSNHL